MATQFHIDLDGERVKVSLYSLREYEAAGGCYCDAGTGGEYLAEHDPTAAHRAAAAREAGYAAIWPALPEPARDLVRLHFVAAATVADNATGLADNDILEAAGVPRHAYWYDSATGYFLLREWPAEAPLAARLVEGAATA